MNLVLFRTHGHAPNSVQDTRTCTQFCSGHMNMYLIFSELTQTLNSALMTNKVSVLFCSIHTLSRKLTSAQFRSWCDNVIEIRNILQKVRRQFRCLCHEAMYYFVQIFIPTELMENKDKHKYYFNKQNTPQVTGSREFQQMSLPK